MLAILESILEPSGVEATAGPPNSSPTANADALAAGRMLGANDFFGEIPLSSALRDFVAHFHSERNHQRLANRRKALLLMGAVHFRRQEGKPSHLEEELRTAGAKAFVVLPGTNIGGTYDGLESRFENWSWPWLVRLKDTRVGAGAASVDERISW